MLSTAPPPAYRRLMSRRLFVVQHADKERHGPDPGVTSLGRAQAARTAEWLASLGAARRLVSSPLRRAVETATIIGQALGLDVSIDPRLRERMNWQGEEHQTFEEFLAEWEAASRDRSFVPRAGDASRDAAARFLAAVEDLARAAADGDDLVVVTHGGVTVDALRTLLGDELVRTRCPGLIEQGIASCSVTQLHWDDGAWRVLPPSAVHLEGSVERDRVADGRAWETSP